MVKTKAQSVSFLLFVGFQIVFNAIVITSATTIRLTVPSSSTSKGAVKASSNTEDAYLLVASAISDRIANLLNDNKSHYEPVDADFVTKVATSLKTMSNAQGALKSLDGAAHEMYQRTQKKQRQEQSQLLLLSKEDSKVTGRTSRSAVRTGCVADAFLACELCELIEFPELTSRENALSSNGTLFDKEVLMNTSIPMETDGFNNNNNFGTTASDSPELSIIVLYDPHYNGGAGTSHGGIDQLIAADYDHTNDDNESSHRRGRILVLLCDNLSNNLEATLRYLDAPPHPLMLKSGLVANEAVSVHKNLWRTAGHALEKLAPTLFSPDFITGTNSTTSSSLPVAIHFVGRSLSGGVAGLAAAILDGTLPMPSDIIDKQHRKKGKRRGRSPKSSKTAVPKENMAEYIINNDNTTATSTLSLEDINGFGRGRTSALLLGPPPCLSSNVRAAFVTTIMYGDDIIPRATQDSFNRLCQRVSRHMKGGMLGKRIGLLSDAVSLTMSSLKAHVAGSEGEESRLSLPGRGFLIRPRR